jgi:hypothetical protein
VGTKWFREEMVSRKRTLRHCVAMECMQNTRQDSRFDSVLAGDSAHASQDNRSTERRSPTVRTRRPRRGRAFELQVLADRRRAHHDGDLLARRVQQRQRRRVAWIAEARRRKSRRQALIAKLQLVARIRAVGRGAADRRAHCRIRQHQGETRRRGRYTLSVGRRAPGRE